MKAKGACQMTSQLARPLAWQVAWPLVFFEN